MDTVAPCGVECAKCPSFPVECGGCREIEGRVFWAPYFDREVCPMYECPVVDREYHDCGECSELPCAIFFDCRDPSVPVGEHEREIGERVRRLRGGG